MAKVTIIGAGIMGLAAAWQAVRDGHAVTVYEAAPQAGGMAAHFHLGTLSAERFYHFVCRSDDATFALLDELALSGALRWRDTSMGYFMGGALHRWGDPIALLRFPHLTLWQKFRYGLLAWVSARRDRWDRLEHETARTWITRWSGRAVYDRMWRQLFDQKMHQYADDISAAWIWKRIRRIGRSRRSMMQEQLGYIEGGSETLVEALVAAIRARGGAVHLAAPVETVVTQNGRVAGVQVAGALHAADYVISTVPTPYVAALVPDLPEPTRAAYAAIVNIGVVCVALHLRRAVTPHFWVNVNEPDIDIPGIIEFSNLRPVDGHVVYVPFYMPDTHPKWPREDAAFVAESLACLMRINPALTQEDVIASHVGRLRHAQPVCPPDFARRLPPVQTPIAGLQIADTCFYYPEDRGLSESIAFGRAMASALPAG